jgi:SAM-dependent methyltransferase
MTKPMSERERWNAKYSRMNAPEAPSAVLVELARFLPPRGQALDLAGGAGRHAIWLAQRGLDVTLADVSDEALRIASQRATNVGVSLRMLRADLETDPLPQGPWDLILSCLYLQRRLFAELTRQLSPRGTLIVIQPTTVNLERHEKPPREYLLEPNEILQLVPDLEILLHREAWSSDDRHDAVLVATRT